MGFKIIFDIEDVREINKPYDLYDLYNGFYIDYQNDSAEIDEYDFSIVETIKEFYSMLYEMWTEKDDFIEEVYYNEFEKWAMEEISVWKSYLDLKESLS